MEATRDKERERITWLGLAATSIPLKGYMAISCIHLIENTLQENPHL